MIIVTDTCPKSGLKREIEFVKFVDNKLNSTLLLDCNINYYNKETNEFIATNILTKDNILITLSNETNLEGIGEYDYWKGLLNDNNAMNSKSITGFDSLCVYIIMKAYLNNLFNE
jgi:hypothetical protein